MGGGKRGRQRPVRYGDIVGVDILHVFPAERKNPVLYGGKPTVIYIEALVLQNKI